MKIFLKAQLSSLMATAVDFLLMICFVEIFKVHFTAGVILGAMGGAMTNFLVNRYWSFEVTDKPVKEQSFKYILVWTGSVLLNVCGVYFVTNLLKISYVFSKIIVAIVVGLSFNYVLQKKYVFSTK